MTFDQFIRVIKARLMLVISIASAIVLIVLVVSLLLPKSYTATATVMVDSRPDPVTALSMSTLAPNSYLATQVDIIKSPAVARRVVQNLKLDQSPALQQRWRTEAKGQGDYVSWVASTIGRGLEVKPSRESNVIDINFDGADPAFSSAMANAFAQAYIDSTVSIKVDPARRYADFFEERSKLARAKLEAAQDKLAEAQREKGIVVTEERLDVEMARLNELGTQITATRALKAESGSRSAVARENPDRIQDVLNNTVVASIKADLSREEAHLEELSARYGEAHPLVKETQANIDALKQRLRAETSKVTTSVALTNNINSAREAEAVKEYEEQRARVLKMKQDRADLQVLEREVESAQHIYESIQQRLSQINLESNSNQSSIYLLSPATEPIKPSSPKVMINTLVAATLGSFIAVMVALGVETLNRRVRGPYDLVQALDLPVLGVLPSPNQKRFWQRLGVKAGDSNPGRPKAIGASNLNNAIDTV